MPPINAGLVALEEDGEVCVDWKRLDGLNNRVLRKALADRNVIFKETIAARYSKIWEEETRIMSGRKYLDIYLLRLAHRPISILCLEIDDITLNYLASTK
jgi:hypothetical protein